jgi:hypothetical protein
MKKTKCLQFTCHSVDIDFLSDSEKVSRELLENKDELPDTIPGIEVKPKEEGVFLERRIEYNNQPTTSICVDPVLNQTKITMPENKIFLPDISYMALSMFAKELNADDKYFVHSAVVEKDGKATMLIGEGGSGKSTLALYLCMNKGFKLLSNDRTVVGVKDSKPYVFTGTMGADVRVGMIPEYFPQMMGKIDEKLFENSWGNKVSINSEFEDWGIETSHGADIANVIYPTTFPTDSKNTTVGKFSKDDEVLKLMGAVSEYIRGDRNIILSANFPAPSFDTHELAVRRMGFVRKLLSDANVYYARGNIKEIADKIDQELYAKKTKVNLFNNKGIENEKI